MAVCIEEKKYLDMHHGIWRNGMGQGDSGSSLSKAMLHGDTRPLKPAF